MTIEEQRQLAIKFVFGEEGPDSDDPRTDPNGGLTRFGISQKQNPDVDVAALTFTTAMAFMLTKHWDANNLDQVPWPLNYVAFDAEVNQGDRPGTRFLQEALGFAEPDGVIGALTIRAAWRVPEGDRLEICKRALAKRAVAYTKLQLFTLDGEGWEYRLMTVAMNCALTQGK